MSYPHPINIEIVHCTTQIGIPEAKRAEYVIKRVFPNAHITRKCPGVIKNLLVYEDGDLIFDRQVDGYLNDRSEDYLMDKLKTKVGVGELREGKNLSDDFERDSLWFHNYLIF